MISSGTHSGIMGHARSGAFVGARPFSFRPYWDEGAMKYIQAFNATGAQIPLYIKQAINKFYKVQRMYGNIRNLEIFYLYIGGRASAHAINGKTPGTYNITWNGTGIVHNANGVIGATGTTNYGSTGWNPAVDTTVSSQNSMSIGSFYRRTPGTGIDIGSSNGTNILSGGGLYFGIQAPSMRGLINNTVIGGAINPVNNGGYLTSGNRRTNNVITGLKNGSQVSSHNVSSAAPVSLVVYVAGCNFNGTAAGSANTVSFTFIGSGDVNQRILADSLNLLQAKLGRI